MKQTPVRTGQRVGIRDGYKKGRKTKGILAIPQQLLAAAAGFRIHASWTNRRNPRLFTPWQRRNLRTGRPASESI